MGRCFCHHFSSIVLAFFYIPGNANSHHMRRFEDQVVAREKAGHVVGYEETQKILDLMQMDVAGSGFFSDDKVYQIEIKGLGQNFIIRAAAYLQEHGHEISEENIKKVWDVADEKPANDPGG